MAIPSGTHLGPYEILSALVWAEWVRFTARAIPS
jgi:hypothetical protein